MSCKQAAHVNIVSRDINYDLSTLQEELGLHNVPRPYKKFICNNDPKIGVEGTKPSFDDLFENSVTIFSNNSPILWFVIQLSHTETLSSQPPPIEAPTNLGPVNSIVAYETRPARPSFFVEILNMVFPPPQFQLHSLVARPPSGLPNQVSLSPPSTDISVNAL